jgi:hypothetical protein
MEQRDGKSLQETLQELRERYAKVQQRLEQAYGSARAELLALEEKIKQDIAEMERHSEDLDT